MFAIRFCNVARRVSTAGTPSLPRLVAIPCVRLLAPRRRGQPYSTTVDSRPSAFPTQNKDDDLRKMDVDAMEAQLKQWFGDHATWSHEKLRELTVPEPLIPPHELMSFGDFATGALRANNSQSPSPLMTAEEIGLLYTPYQRWSEGPSAIQDNSCQEALSPLFGATHVGTDLKVPPFADLPARLLPLKAKLWQGMAPMSHDRWLERKMDDPANYRNLVELVEDILYIFIWFNQDVVLNRMRAAFNFLVDKHVDFAAPVNLRREQNGVSEKLDLASMWAEYLHSRISTMSDRTHHWLVERVEEMQNRALAQYTATLEDLEADEDSKGAAGKKFFECVRDINTMMTKADVALYIPMTGFNGYTPSGNSSELSLLVRQDFYAKLSATKSWKYRDIMLEAEKRETGPDNQEPKDLLAFVEQMKKGPQPAAPRFRDQNVLLKHYHEGNKNRTELREALRGEPKRPGEEQWITILKERMNFYLANGRDHDTHRWGFVCYRVTYKQSDAEWRNFMEKFEADMRKAGTWVEGWDSISDKMGLEMIDGRDVGIAEGDVEAAKRHFKSAYTMLPTLGRMWAQDFLVIDAQSYSSYAHPEPEQDRPPPPFGPCFGDRGGFVRLVDTVSYPQEMLDETSPGYKGEIKVLSSLVFEELYPVLATFAARPRALWPLARLHPREVYVGHSTAAQESWWEFCRIDTVAMTSGIFEQMRKKKAALPKQ